MPLPTMREVEKLHLGRPLKIAGQCLDAHCGNDAAPGHFYCHRCRARMGLNEQPTLFTVPTREESMNRRIKWTSQRVSMLRNIAHLGIAAARIVFPDESDRAIRRVCERHRISLRT